MSNSSARPAQSGSVPRQHGAMEFTTAPVDLDAVRLCRLARLRTEMKRGDVASPLMFDQITTRYATDAANMQVWSSHYETRCVFVALEGPMVLFDYANRPHLAGVACSGDGICEPTGQCRNASRKAVEWRKP
jgi:hypothetical protein